MLLVQLQPASIKELYVIIRDINFTWGSYQTLYRDHRINADNLYLRVWLDGEYPVQLKDSYCIRPKAEDDGKTIAEAKLFPRRPNHTTWQSLARNSMPLVPTVSSLPPTRDGIEVPDNLREYLQLNTANWLQPIVTRNLIAAGVISSTHTFSSSPLNSIVNSGSRFQEWEVVDVGTGDLLRLTMSLQRFLQTEYYVADVIPITHEPALYVPPGLWLLPATKRVVIAVATTNYEHHTLARQTAAFADYFWHKYLNKHAGALNTPTRPTLPCVLQYKAVSNYTLLVNRLRQQQESIDSIRYQLASEPKEEYPGTLDIATLFEQQKDSLSLLVDSFSVVPPTTIKYITHPITAKLPWISATKTVTFGQLEVTVNVSSGEVSVRKAPGNSLVTGLIHPHVSNNGSPCMGKDRLVTGRIPLDEVVFLARMGRFVDMICLINGYLASPQSTGAYYAAERWPDVEVEGDERAVEEVPATLVEDDEIAPVRPIPCIPYRPFGPNNPCVTTNCTVCFPTNRR